MAAHSPRGQRPDGQRAGATVVVAVLAATMALAAPAMANDTEPGPPPAVEPVVVTLAGTPIDDEGGHRVEGCTIAVGVTGLGAEASVPVEVHVAAVAPTVPEGTSLTILEQFWTASGPTSTTDVDLTELVTELEPRSNGYRLSIAVSVDGTAIGAKQVWLACGAPQDGHPNRIVFEVRWLDVDGQPFEPPLDTAMAPGWRDPFAIEAASIRGTARCTIPAGSEQLVCEYDNPDHGSKPGLVVPGGRHHTYDVAQLGLPGRWAVDASTVGTFVGRETCGTGGCGGDGGSGGHEGDTGGCDGHEGDGHEEAAASVNVAADETTSACTHGRQPVPRPAAASVDPDDHDDDHHDHHDHDPDHDDADHVPGRGPDDRSPVGPPGRRDRDRSTRDRTPRLDVVAEDRCAHRRSGAPRRGARGLGHGDARA